MNQAKKRKMMSNLFIFNNLYQKGFGTKIAVYFVPEKKSTYW